MPQNSTGVHIKWWLGCGLLIGIAVAFAGRGAVSYTSSDTFCNTACHAHPQATQQWTQSPHYANRRGVVVHCVDCHLPPGGIDYLTEKAKLGARDAYGELFRDVSKIDWARERQLDRAVTFTYDSSCLHCHSNLFSQRLAEVNETLPAGAQQTDRLQQREMGLVAHRMEAHEYYQRNRDRLRCVNCHLYEGHLQPPKMMRQGAEVATAGFPLAPEAFQNYTEVMPGLNIRFHLIAVPAGAVEMGGPELGRCRQRDTGPAHSVAVKAFWMTEFAVGAQELRAFYADRKPSGKPGDEAKLSDDPPSPTQEIAKEYAEWLSRRTGKPFRLPTEAELEYACIAGESMPSWIVTDSRAVSHVADMVKLNPWGFADLPGNAEFTVDFPPAAPSANSESARSGYSFRVVQEAGRPEQTGSARLKTQAPRK
jgi:sulfatase modifying factor 1